ncbi:hypothetical protein AMECASPLE_013469, partial [Ameca splendens]
LGLRLDGLGNNNTTLCSQSPYGSATQLLQDRVLLVRIIHKSENVDRPPNPLLNR